jgi:nucleoside-diphosphate-sugar epimerase
MKRVLITGGNGFVGKALVCQLRTSRVPLYLWNREENGSLLDSTARKKTLDSHDFNTVIHLAWNSISDRDYDRNPQNIKFATATIDFRNEVLNRGSSFITLGTVFEELPLENGNLYQESKIRIAKECAKDSFEKTLWIRPTYIFSFSSLRPRILNAISNDPSLEINNPDKLCDWIEVRDVASAIEHSLQLSDFGRINLSSGIKLSVRDFANRYKKMCLDFSNLENLDGQLQEKSDIEVGQNDLQINILSATITQQYLTNS